MFHPPGSAHVTAKPRDEGVFRTPSEAGVPARHAFLGALGARVRALRTRRGMTRKALARVAAVSERHLANLEYGQGNASILVLQQVADALRCPLAELVGEPATASPEWLAIVELLEGRDEATLRRVHAALGELLATAVDAEPPASRRIALIGLRGAGKSTLGQRLADDLGFPFIELSRRIEDLAGCGIAEIQALYGVNAYRRYERRALEEAIAGHAEAVIATPGGLVSDPASFDLLRARCLTVWLQARPEDHLRRVVAKDLRVMATDDEAMEDLKTILASHRALYAQAALSLDTSGQTPEASFEALRAQVRAALKPGA